MSLRTVVLVLLTAGRTALPAAGQNAEWADAAGLAGIHPPGRVTVSPDRPSSTGRSQSGVVTGVHVPFGLRELMEQRVAVFHEAARTGWAAGLSRRAFGDYAGTHVFLLSSRVWADSLLRTGASVTVVHERLGHLGSRARVDATVGATVRISTWATVALHTDVNALRMDALLRVVRNGPVPVASLDIDPMYGRSASIGLLWPLSPQVTVRTGFRDRPETLAAGLSVHAGPVGLDWAVAAIPGPGWSTWMQVNWAVP